MFEAATLLDSNADTASRADKPHLYYVFVRSLVLLVDGSIQIMLFTFHRHIDFVELP